MCTLGNGRHCVGNQFYGIGSINLHSAVTGTTGSGGNGRHCVGNQCYGIGSIHLHSAVTGTTGTGVNVYPW